MTWRGRELRSKIDKDGRLTLSLEEVTVGDPDEGEIVVRVEATPINPSDLGMLLGPADVSTLAMTEGGHSRVCFTVPPDRLPGVWHRLGQSLRVGNEGAGTVVAAGSGAEGLMGKLVGMVGGGMYADYRRIPAGEVVVLPDGVTAIDGASMFVNPLTALGFVETARREGHRAIIHTAAASNLGQMLQRVCLADDIPLINIVRSEGQCELLRAMGASHVLNSKGDNFTEQLRGAIRQTGATIAFDAIGGGSLGSEIIQCIERAAVEQMTEFSRYGSDVFKQLYIYGGLDTSPTTLNRPAFGFQWSVGGWLLFPFLRKAGEEVATRLRKRVLAELTTTFASRYTRVIGLSEALQPEVLRSYERKTTGEKFLIDPTRG